HEVILLTIGVLGIVQGRDGAAGDAVQGLINSGQGEPGRAIVLAGEAVADAYPGGVTPACQQVVVQELLKTLRNDKVVKPVLRAHAGRTLARLGDPRPEVMTLEGMEFCYVPPGPFIMGSGDDDPLAYADEKPQHTYAIPYGYWIGRYPVTNAQFAPFVAAGGYQEPTWWPEALAAGFWRPGEVQDVYYMLEDKKLVRHFDGWRDQPVEFGYPFSILNSPRVGLSWYEALAYTRWLTSVLQNNKLLPQNLTICLPNEPEWEKAGRGGITLPSRSHIQKLTKLSQKALLTNKTRRNTAPTRRFPWGNSFEVNRLNYKDTKIETTNTVGAFPCGASLYGANELCGNFWEWTRSLWGNDVTSCDFTYPYSTSDRREQLTDGLGMCRVARGGSFNNKARKVRLAARLRTFPATRDVALRLVVLPSTFDG
ncbi:MAG: formylglycine-generating enzyme family protein, partial [Planctomycetes bacterium]|nr:formylglycine-generating enzyme family protein [Planctomycetota bacterium]